ncbi:MAG: tetratricopeptide repeat protein [Bacteroidales bacterium]|nr:tetratricopeptide repeat protein [Bacteroidales bacterium]
MIILFLVVSNSKGNDDSIRVVGQYKAFSIEEIDNITDKYDFYSDTTFYYLSCLLREKAQISNNKYYEAKSLRKTGLFYLAVYDYANALSSLMESQNLAQEINNKELLGDIFLTLGQIYYEIENNTESLNYYYKALELFKKLNIPEKIVSADNKIGVVFLRKGEMEKAIDHFKRIIEYNNSLDEKQDLTPVYNNIGYAYSHNSENEEALKYFYLALSMSKETNDLKGMNRIKINIGRMHYLIKNYSEGEKYLNEALAGARSINDLSTVSLCYYYFHSFYSVQKNYEKALEFYRKHTALNDSLFRDESNRLIEKLKASYELQRKSQESKLQKAKFEARETKLKKIEQRNSFLIVLLVLIVIIAILFYFWIRFRARQHKEISLKENALVKAELENTQLAEKHLKEKLEHKNVELKNLALHIVEKNSFLETIINEMEKLNNQEDNKCFLKIKSMIESNLSNDSQKKEFETYIEQIHQETIFKLDKHFPNLSNNEKRLAILLMLELSSKEISILFNITAKSVDMNRYRLRKKMNVPAEQNFSEFLNQLSG